MQTLRSPKVKKVLREWNMKNKVYDENFARVLKCLLLIPRHIVLSVASRDMELQNGCTCLLAWTMREHLLAVAGQETTDEISMEYPISSVRKAVPRRRVEALLDGAEQDEEVAYLSAEAYCAAAFGGDIVDWSFIYFNVFDDEQRGGAVTATDEHKTIETAWSLRVHLAACHNA